MSRKTLAKLTLMALLVTGTLLSLPGTSEAAFSCYCNGKFLGFYNDVMACYNDCQP